MLANRKCIIDGLRICYIAEDNALQQLNEVEIGGQINVDKYVLFRKINDRFGFYFDVINTDGTEVAVLKFGHNTEKNEGKRHVYYKILNPILYSSELFQEVLRFPETIGLIFNNFTAIDIAFDSSQNLPSLIKKKLRDKETTTILNGKAIKNRKDTVKEISFGFSTSLERLKHPTITIYQKKALKNKNQGIVVQTYNKKAEIENSSEKSYILDFYGKPQRLYRLEVRLPYQEIKDYFKNRGIIPLSSIISEQEILEEMFLYHLTSVIRFSKGRRKLQWKELLNLQ